MKVLSTNIGPKKTIIWRGKVVETGIYKTPVDHPLLLGRTDVDDDTVVDRKHHGGLHKACYLFSAEEYLYWKSLYPHLDWTWGMFGENLTIAGMDESALRIGDVYKIGSATIQISQSRQPCYKLGIRFGDQKVLKEFISHGRPGAYVRVLEPGQVQVGDALHCIERSDNTLTVSDFFQLLYVKEKDRELLQLAIENTALPSKKREELRTVLAKMG